MYAANLFIDGKDLERTTADRFAVTNPATESALGDVPSAGPSEVEAALAAAQRGFDAWRRKTPWERSAIVRRIAVVMRERGPEIARLLTLEVGKPLAESVTEVTVAAEYFDWCADETRRIFGRVVDGRVAGSRLEVSYEPVGVVLALTAWNFPIVLASRKLAMALAAGCAVILRPAEEAPACVAALVRCCHDAGVPLGTVNLLFGTPEAVAKPFLDKMTALALAVKLGDGLHDGVQRGPLAPGRQRERSMRLVDDARSRGATIACGGSRPPGLDRGFFFAPTVLTDLSADATVLTEAPFGGVKQSGFGREGGEDGVREYLNPKFVHQMRA